MGWGSSIAGGVISAAGNIISTGMNNANAKQMAGSSVQTRVKDLRAAGLNPVLAATHGSIQAAQVPQQQTPDLSPIAGIADTITRRMGANSAKQQADNNTRQTDASTALMASQSAKTLADTKVAIGQSELQKSQQHLIDEQALTQSALRANYAANTGLASANAVRTNYQAVQDKVLADYFNTSPGRHSVQDAFNSKGGYIFGTANQARDRVYNVIDRVNNSNSASGVKSTGEAFVNKAREMWQELKRSKAKFDSRNF